MSRKQLRLRGARLVLACALLAGCTRLERAELDDRFGPPVPRDAVAATPGAADRSRWDAARAVLERRCVVCHACYDAPCQLNLGAPEGIARGASKAIVYDGARLLPAELTRLFDDAQDAAGWRARGFFPVLNERSQTPAANLQAGLMARMLALKHTGPAGPEPRAVDLDASHQCPTVEQFDAFAQDHPERGMPFAMAPLPGAEYAHLLDWLAAGAPMAEPDPVPEAVARLVDEWEAFFNAPDHKSQLAARYLYEHLFLANLYFDELQAHARDTSHRFRLVRSRTPPGRPIDLVATRRPFDDPGVARVHYRLQRVDATPVAKTHMPYALNAQRMARWRQWFIDARYEVAMLPSYAPEVASNPFAAFRAIPVASRYRFLLDEAQFTIMGFIKGPVCRGQVALNVIDDRFWVFFADPDSFLVENEARFLARETPDLRLPAEDGDEPGSLLHWTRYAAAQQRYLQDKAAWLEEELGGRRRVDERLVWDGDGGNPNAGLTVFRHFDSATVLQGLVGTEPKTAWIIGYALLERIHYLLVAGFDVYGTLGHQLNTRLYMDFLRMEGEANFLTLLPADVRRRERDHWYREAADEVRDYLFGAHFDPHVGSTIRYRTDDPKAELFALLRRRIGPALSTPAAIPAHDPNAAALASLAATGGQPASLLPEASLLGIVDGEATRWYSLLVDRGFSSVSHLVAEDRFRRPDEDRLTLTTGIATAYPNAFFRINRDRLPEFAAAVAALRSTADAEALQRDFGVARMDPAFWPVSDAVHAAWRRGEPVAAALLDYNRLDAR